MYSYFAKLQLNSLAVRGVSLSPGRRPGRPLSTERKEFANMAISAAASILTFVLEEEDLRRALVGTPLYVHTMIAFASVFLMKVATRWNRALGLNVESHYVAHLLRRIIVLLRSRSAVTSDRHLLYHIAFGLGKMLAKLGLDKPLPSVKPPDDGGGDEAVVCSEISPGQESVVSYGHMGYGPTALAENAALTGDAAVPAGDSSMGWDPYASDSGAGVARGNYFDDLTVMNDSLIYEAFGSESANDVYNLLTSQFSC